MVGASKEELISVSEIVSELIKAHEQNKNINLNRCTDFKLIFKFDGLNNSVHPEYFVHLYRFIILVPKLKVKPIRTASGVLVLGTITERMAMNWMDRICQSHCYDNELAQYCIEKFVIDTRSFGT